MKIEAGDIFKAPNGWEYRIVKYETSYMLFPMNHDGKIIQSTEKKLINYCNKNKRAEIIKNPERKAK